MASAGLSEQGYTDLFNVTPEMALKAWEKSWEIRNFEIQMYWKRATYFWAFIASVFAAYFVVIAGEDYVLTELNMHQYVLIWVGLILSIAWTMVNHGSKLWQENWEKHIDMLENKISGPLYKVILRRHSYSVSKINERISWMMIGLWMALLSKYLFEKWVAFKSDCCPTTAITVVAVAFIFYLVLSSTSTSKLNDKGKMVLRSFELER